MTHRTLRLDGVVGADFDARSVADFLSDAGGEAIEIVVNSPGGNAAEGLAIHAELAAYPGRVTIRIRGVALSAASLLAMAGARITVAPGSMLMLHEPRQWASMGQGTAEDHRADADMLDRMSDSYAAIYAQRMGRPVAEVRAMMAAETWFTAEEAVAAGLADEIETAATPVRAAAFAYQTFRNAPPALVALAQAHSWGDPAMTDTTTAAAPAAPTASARAERARVQAIMRAFATAELGADHPEAVALIEAGATADAAAARALNLMAEAQAARLNAPGNPPPTIPPAGWREPRAAMADRLAAWLDGEDPRSGRAMTLGMVAMHACRSAGLRPWDAAEAVPMAFHTVSDFVHILDSTIGTTVARRIDQRLPDLVRVSHEISRSDYRAAKRVEASATTAPALVNEAGEVQHVTLNDGGETMPTLEDYASILALSNKVLVNDASAHGALLDVTQRMAEGAIERLRRVLVAPLEANGGAGQTLANGQPVFHSSRGNVAATGGGISLATLSAGLMAMRGQRGRGGELLAVEPRFIVVSPKREIEALQMVASITPADATDANPFAGRLQVVVEPALANPDAWFLVGDPARFDGLAHSFLDGMRRPRIEGQESWNRLGYEWRLFWPMAAGFVSPSAWFRNPGA